MPLGLFVGKMEALFSLPCCGCCAILTWNGDIIVIAESLIRE